MLRRDLVGVFVRDCDCDLVARGCALVRIENFRTDAEALRAFIGHKLENELDDSHRYWIIHGPSGHLIGVR